MEPGAVDQEVPEGNWLLTGSLNTGWDLEMGYGQGEVCSLRHWVGKESLAGKGGMWRVVGALVSADVQCREGKKWVSCGQLWLS